MTKTFAQLIRDVKVLRDQLADGEKAVAQIRDMAVKHRLVAEDIFPAGKWPGERLGEPEAPASTETAEGGVLPVAPENQAAPTVRAKYADGKGNTWSGMGRRPKWLAAALAEGKKIEQFLTKKPAKRRRTRSA